MESKSVADWRQSGTYKETSIPVPTGKHEVGCVDLMHRDLLVRMFYPTDPGLTGVHEYTQWLPNSMYAQGFIDFASSILRPDIKKPSVESLMSKLLRPHGVDYWPNIQSVVIIILQIIIIITQNEGNIIVLSDLVRYRYKFLYHCYW